MRSRINPDHRIEALSAQWQGKLNAVFRASRDEFIGGL
jgi:hypothetical protein